MKKERLLFLKSSYEDELMELIAKEMAILPQNEKFADYVCERKDWLKDQIRKIEKELSKMD